MTRDIEVGGLSENNDEDSELVEKEEGILRLVIGLELAMLNLPLTPTKVVSFFLCDRRRLD